ncbi:MAG: phosphoribosylanthranilate isomerase [Actinobacteria bacterium]|nr:phosphoribosylanthranilate isomerase [Actinomycetota bacterium]
MLIKICGITNEEDALLSVAMGATALGFVFAPSRRQVSPGKVSDIVKRLPPGVLTVGVFRDSDPKTVLRTVREAGLRGAQLHGRESVAQVDEVVAELGWVMKAVVAGSPDAQRCNRYRTDLVLFDSPEPGSGVPYDWGLLADVPKDIRCVVSGGLTPDNVALAIETVRPFGVDVSSGVEAGATCPRRWYQRVKNSKQHSTTRGQMRRFVVNCADCSRSMPVDHRCSPSATT